MPFPKAKAVGGRQDADTAMVQSALAILADPIHGIQLQAAPTWAFQTFCGNDPGAAIQWVVRHADATGIYYGLNPVAPSLDHRAKVVDALCRRWLLIDVDRAKGEDDKDLSATNDEHLEAMGLADDVLEFLNALDWPSPVLVDSGNGFHLLYRLDLPNDEDSRVLVKQVLAKLAEKFDGAKGTIGAECYDARRIAKLPGTWARRGEASPERPHRLCKLIHVPAAIEPVSMERLKALVDWQAPAEPEGETAGLHARATGSNGSKAYYLTALEREVARVKLAKIGKRNESLNRAAFSLAQLVAGGGLSQREVEVALHQAAVDVGLDEDPGCGERGIWATIRSGFAAGMQKPRTAPEDGQAAGAGHPAPDSAEITWGVEINGEVVRSGVDADLVALGKQRRIAYQDYKLLNLGTIMNLDLPEPVWVIPGILAEGLNLLAGSPKSGKSMLALNLCLTVAGGGLALGNVQTSQGGVLYLSLEDRLRRVKSRATKMAALCGPATAANLTIATRWPRMDRGGLVLLSEWLIRTDNPLLLVVDVLGKFRPLLRDRGNQYEQDSEHMYAIKEFADENKINALILHHTRKLVGKDKDRDEFEDVSGTQGIAGGCDGILLLKRARQSNDAMVSITGRDEAEQKLALQFDPATLTWTSMGGAEAFLTGRLQLAIVEYMRGLVGATVFNSQLADHLENRGLHASADTIRKAMHRLKDQGIIQQRGHAWVYPGP